MKAKRKKRDKKMPETVLHEVPEFTGSAAAKLQELLRRTWENSSSLLMGAMKLKK
jgi:hypothetical protein